MHLDKLDKQNSDVSIEFIVNLFAKLLSTFVTCTPDNHTVAEPKLVGPLLLVPAWDQRTPPGQLVSEPTQTSMDAIVAQHSAMPLATHIKYWDNFFGWRGCPGYRAQVEQFCPWIRVTCPAPKHRYRHWERKHFEEKVEWWVGDGSVGGWWEDGRYSRLPHSTTDMHAPHTRPAAACSRHRVVQADVQEQRRPGVDVASGAVGAANKKINAGYYKARLAAAVAWLRSKGLAPAV